MMSIAEALNQSKNGRALVIEVNTRNAEKADRIRQLKELVYQAVVVSPKKGFPRRKDLYDAAKPKIKTLGITGGHEYEKALTAVKFMWNSEADWKAAVALLTK